MVDYMPALQDIKDTVAAAVPNCDIVQTHDDVTVGPTGILKSYVILTFGGPLKYPLDKGITESANNPNLMWCTVQCVSSNAMTSDRIKQLVFSALEDHYPPNSGRMIADGGYSHDTKNSNVKPVRYVSAVRFSFVHNLVS